MLIVIAVLSLFRYFLLTDTKKHSINVYFYNNIFFRFYQIQAMPYPLNS